MFPRNITRVRVTFYWPWARIGSAIKSRVTDSGNQDNKVYIKGKQAAQKVAGSRRARAWVKKGNDTKKETIKGGGKGEDNTTKPNSSTDSKLKGFKSLFRRSTKRTPVQYFEQEAVEEVWYKRRRISITQHMARMREAMRRRSKQVKEFNDLHDDDDDDSLSQTPMTRKYKWWVVKWWNLYESGDPVVEKSAEELADMSALTDRLRSLRLEHGLAEEWMQKELEISDVISLEEESIDETPSPPENPWVVISSFFRDPSLALTESPYTSDEKHSLSGSMLNNTSWMNQTLPGMSVQ